MVTLNIALKTVAPFAAASKSSHGDLECVAVTNGFALASDRYTLGIHHFGEDESRIAIPEGMVYLIPAKQAPKVVSLSLTGDRPIANLSSGESLLLEPGFDYEGSLWAGIIKVLKEFEPADSSSPFFVQPHYLARFDQKNFGVPPSKTFRVKVETSKKMITRTKLPLQVRVTAPDFPGFTGIIMTIREPEAVPVT